MDKVKSMLKPGKDTATTVESTVAPEVTHEHVRPQEQEIHNKEVFQDRDIHHHQHRVQPVVDSVVDKTKHVDNVLDTEHVHRNYDLGKEGQQKLNTMHDGFQDEQTMGDVERSRVEGKTNVGGRTTHHIHETIQPVVERERVQPTTIHTTERVHEHITDRPVIHEQSVEQPISIDQFNKNMTSTHGNSRTTRGEFPEQQPQTIGT